MSCSEAKGGSRLCTTDRLDGVPGNLVATNISSEGCFPDKFLLKVLQPLRKSGLDRVNV